MIVVKTPKVYVNAPGAIKQAGKYIAEFGKKPLVIGGKTALEAVGDDFFESLKAHGIEVVQQDTFQGFPSENQFQKYAQIAQNTGADMLIGIGGGRVLDTAKATGNLLGLPIVTVPTIAATCAAWAAVTIQYDDNGAYVQSRRNENSASLVLADPEIILKAPVRYLFSGVVDTFAKLYEIRPTSEHYPENITIDLALHGAQIAFDRLKDETFLALEEAEKGIYGQAAQDVIDAIIYLAGFAGSFQDQHERYGFAHPFYHVSTRLPDTRIRLHGEKVAFGIVAQLFLEQRPEAEIVETIKLFQKYNAAFTLENLGIKEHRAEDLAFLKQDILNTFSYVKYSPEQIEQSLIDADRLTRNVLSKNI